MSRTVQEDQCLSQGDAALNKVLHSLGLIDRPGFPSGLLLASCGQIEFFANAGHFDEWEAIEKVAEELSIQPYDLGKWSSDDLWSLMGRDPISRIAAARWLEMCALPVIVDESSVLVVMSNPLDNEVKTALEFELDRRVSVAIGSEAAVRNLLTSQLVGSEGYDLKSILRASKDQQIRIPGDVHDGAQENVVSDDPTAAPIVRLVNKIFHEAVHLEASDIHISPEKDGLEVKVRVDGIMRSLFDIPGELSNAVVSRIKLLGGMNIAEKRLPQDGRIRLTIDDGEKDLRLSTVPASFGENLVARILSPEIAHVAFDSLGLDGECRERFERALTRSSRVNLVTGPTGAGKTSTLYAALLSLRDGKSNIITLEDPIEYRLKGTTQIQINSKIGLTFAQGLRSILRQDPDIILVGEIRDAETAAIAMQVAQTGHLVLSTLHTNSVEAAITRLRDLEVPAFVVASSLGSVMAQRLVRKLCSACAVEDEEGASSLESDGVMRAVGCSECNGSGYKGRVGVFSFLEVTESVSDAIREELGEDEILRRARANGYVSLHEAGYALVKEGATSLREVERVLGPVQHSSCSDQSQASQHSERTSELGKRRVLLVEDDHDTCCVLKMLLEKALYDVTVAEDGHKGLEQIYQNPPDLVVCDVMMPQMSGPELLKRLRSDERTRGIPVLMLTANATDEQELDLVSSGADDFVSKTTKSEILLARVERLISRSN